MKRRNRLSKIFQIFLIAGLLCGCEWRSNSVEPFTSFVVDATQIGKIELFWRDEKGVNFGSIENVKNHVEQNGKRLRFAMNGGMYQEDGRPLGLFIQNGKQIAPLNVRRNATGNFYIEPNGVFYTTTDGQAGVTTTQNFANDGRVKFATQSGPMLIVDGAVNPQFKPDSDNLNIRNGVCAADDGKIIFAVSRSPVSFYDFAEYFKSAGCRNALYLDGFVSRMYLPEKSIAQTDGDFGVIIAAAE